MLRNIVQENASLYLDEIALQMEIRLGKKLHNAVKERNELLCSAFMARIGSQYKREQLVFLDESSKDE
ncbi:36031_t:CDS:2 [Gigaspora margarita]|uniref:36031_t:CDS:1 n=1 Tax=Gigaspora margarita TaxID=4874 RepID=A0ABN7X6E6_GIGMA|nr:36031_t:CDS:2 [Gigaspora margarita]